MALFIEEVRGDFDIRVFGVAFGKYFNNGWKAATGPGIETKLKDNKNLFLWHVTAGYDWHRGNWSYGPIEPVDFIEDASNTFYLGFSVGHGFQTPQYRKWGRTELLTSFQSSIYRYILD